MNYKQLTNQSKILFSYLIKYLEENELPTPNNKIKFKDIGYPCETTLYSFLNAKLHNYYLALENECLLYKDKYPKAYQKLKTKIEKRKTFLHQNQKTEIFMRYIENNDIPSSRSTIYFYQIEPTTKNNSNVGVWLQEQIAHNVQKLLKECSKYKNQYPKAYEKICLRLAKKLKINIHTTRLEVILKYLEKNPNYHITGKNRFCDIDKNCVDKIYICSWFQIQTTERLNEFKEELLSYKNKYPKGFEVLNEKLNNLENNRQIQFLTTKERLKIVMDYFERNEKTLSLNIKFNDLNPNLEDNTLIQSWIIRKIRKKDNEFMEELKSYQHTHPLAYQKILYRIEKIQNHEHDPLYLKKIELFMKFADTFSINGLSNLKFSDIDSDCNIGVNVVYWFHNQIYGKIELSKFIEEMSKYKDIYPNAYHKVSEYLNHNKTHLKKERQDLLNLLKNLRTELATYESTTLIQETHLIKQKSKI